MKTQHEAPKCARQEELVEYLYDEMPLQHRALFAEHLSECPACSTDLQGMQRLRGELRAWDLSTVPRMELVIPRSRLDVFKELLSLFPLWSRGVVAVAGAAAMLLIAFGTVSLFRQINTAPQLTATLTATPPPVTPTVQPALTPEVKALVNAEVAKAVEQERQTLRAQLAERVAHALGRAGRSRRAQPHGTSRVLPAHSYSRLRVPTSHPALLRTLEGHTSVVLSVAVMAALPGSGGNGIQCVRYLSSLVSFHSDTSIQQPRNHCAMQVCCASL